MAGKPNNNMGVDQMTRLRRIGETRQRSAQKLISLGERELAQAKAELLGARLIFLLSCNASVRQMDQEVKKFFPVPGSVNDL